MIIENKNVVVYDIEVFPNLIHMVLKNTELPDNIAYVRFEISERKNDLNIIYNTFLNSEFLFCGYNCIHYDNPIINYLIIHKVRLSTKTYDIICNEVYNLSNTIVNTEDFESWKTYKYAKNFKTLDLLTMLFSSKLRCSLKAMEVTMQVEHVDEYEGDFTKPLPIEEIDRLAEYNKHDVENTAILLERCKEDIDLRLGIKEEFNLDVLSKDGMTIGIEILKTKYLEKIGKTYDDIKDLRSPCDIIDLNNIIFSNVKFKTKILQDFLEELKQQKVSAGRKGYEKKFLYNNKIISFGVGGLHTIDSTEIIKPLSNEILADSDVNSLYPSLIISYNIIPKHIDKKFLEVYGQIREDRLYAKRNGLKVKNETYKLALNGTTGNYQNQHSWLYDPEAVLKIRINGQLFLLMLAEKIVEAGGTIKQLNTDGVLYTINKNVDINSILKEWENETNLTLETEYYEAFYQYAGNDYLAIGKGFSKSHDPKLLKVKGLFIHKPILGKGLDALIVPKAIIAYFTEGISVEKYIKDSKNIHDFISYQKVDKSFCVEYNHKLINRINRYYCSTDGYYLKKCKIDNNGNRYAYEKMNSKSGVTICNTILKDSSFPTNINYQYYISQANKIINEFEYQQLNLF